MEKKSRSLSTGTHITNKLIRLKQKTDTSELHKTLTFKHTDTHSRKINTEDKHKHTDTDTLS